MEMERKEKELPELLCSFVRRGIEFLCNCDVCAQNRKERELLEPQLKERDETINELEREIESLKFGYLRISVVVLLFLVNLVAVDFTIYIWAKVVKKNNIKNFNVTVMHRYFSITNGTVEFIECIYRASISHTSPRLLKLKYYH